MLNRRLLIAGVMMVAAGLAVASSAQAGKPVKLNDEQVAAVRKLNDYINGVKYMRGDFSQISPSGKLAKGVFFISKPGKMRFEYAPPVPLMIVSDGKWVMIKNKNKENGDAGPLSKTPLRIVLAEKVDLLKDATITNYEEGDGLVSVTMEDKGSSIGGQLVLTYDPSRDALQQWVVIDAKGRRTTVTLENVVTGEKPDPKLFVVKFKPKNQGNSNN
jgi:outer membrane lipoprotein-sorting protein